MPFTINPVTESVLILSAGIAILLAVLFHMLRMEKAPLEPRKRPLGIKILSGLCVIAAAFFMDLASGLLFQTDFSVLQKVLAPSVIFTGFLILGLVALLAAYGLWTGASWAWLLALVVSVMSILLIVLVDYVQFVVGVAMLIYLMRKNVRVWFRES